MGDSASESDSSSIDGGNFVTPLLSSKEVLTKRNESLQQENRVLKMELETYKLRIRTLQEENRTLRQASVNIQAKAEQEEEFISNTLMKQIKILKSEKEKLALNYEREEECLTNDLTRKLEMLRHEKEQLENTLEHEQEALVNKLMRKINKLESDIAAKQGNLEKVRREKVELENTLEQEQEALVNRLWKRMDKLEAEKRSLQERLDLVTSAAQGPADFNKGDIVINLTKHIEGLRSEVCLLKTQLKSAEKDHSQKLAQFAIEEKQVKEENVRLQKQLKVEVERREALCRHLSESESSLEMDDERHFGELAQFGPASCSMTSPPMFHPSPSRSMSPSINLNIREQSMEESIQCPHCGGLLPSPSEQPSLHFTSFTPRINVPESTICAAEPSSLSGDAFRKPPPPFFSS